MKTGMAAWIGACCLLAGAVSLAGQAPGVPDAGAGFEVMRDVPLMIMIGDRDELLPIEGMRNALARLREADVTV